MGFTFKSIHTKSEIVTVNNLFFFEIPHDNVKRITRLEAVSELIKTNVVRVSFFG